MQTELHKLRIEKDQKASRRGARWPWVVAAVLLLGGGAVWSGLGSGRLGGGAPTVSVERVVAPAGSVSESDLVLLNATGYVIAAHKIELASKVVGRVAWVGVERGDQVKKDQVLVKLEDDEYQARHLQQEGMVEQARARLAELEAGSRVEEIAQARAQVDSAQVDVDNAELNLKRYQDLMPTKAVSRQQLDDAEADARSKRAKLESAVQQYELVKAGPRKEVVRAQRAVVKQMEGALANSLIELNNTVIKAPADGTILERNVEVGEFVTTGFVGDRGAKGYVVSMADLTDLRVELDVSQNDFSRTRMNQPCWLVTDAYPDRKYEGVVDLIAPEANRQKATVQVRVKVLSPDGLLRPDMNATVSFLDDSKLERWKQTMAMPPANRPMVRVPKSAVREGAVYVVKNNKVIRRTVTTGDEVGDRVEIRRGLADGEVYVFPLPPVIEDGQTVKLAPGSPAGPAASPTAAAG